jgi:hypothetical protein
VFGGVGIGVVSFSGVSLGLVSIGGVALALLFAFGGVAVAPFALGGLAAGWVAAGGGAVGVHVLNNTSQDPLAKELLRTWYHRIMWLFYILLPFCILTPIVMRFLGARWAAGSKQASTTVAPLHTAQASDPRATLTKPAVSLIISGVATAAGIFTTLAYTDFPMGVPAPWDVILKTAVILVGVVVPLLILRGGLSLLNQESYSASRLGAILATLSFNPISLPIGIWALVVLSRPEVRALFATRRKEG